MFIVLRLPARSNESGTPGGCKRSEDKDYSDDPPQFNCSALTSRGLLGENGGGIKAAIPAFLPGDSFVGRLSEADDGSAIDTQSAAETASHRQYR